MFLLVGGCRSSYDEGCVGSRWNAAVSNTRAAPGPPRPGEPAPWENDTVRASRNSPNRDRTDARVLDRSILTLAVPAFGALVAEPLFLLTDTALVGHLGDTALAGLGVAATVLHTVVGIMVFLAYTTTPSSRGCSAQATDQARSAPASRGCGWPRSAGLCCL